MSMMQFAKNVRQGVRETQLNYARKKTANLAERAEFAVKMNEERAKQERYEREIQGEHNIKNEIGNKLHEKPDRLVKYGKGNLDKGEALHDKAPVGILGAARLIDDKQENEGLPTNIFGEHKNLFRRKQ